MSQTLPLHRVEDWQSQLRNIVTTAEQLLPMLGLNAQDIGFSEQAARDFPMKVPTAFVRRMEAENPRDPLLLQVLASAEELLEPPGYSSDPVQETGSANAYKGVIHKYQGRALLLVSSGCAINCRYCFRRHFPYSENQNSRSEWREALAHIANDPSISEVIFSGGDPLVATDGQLSELVDQVAAIGHVRRLRIHSRLPVVIPDRVTASLLDSITRPNLQTVVVIHCNHANEIDPDVARAMSAMLVRGISLLNQAVLLKGVNDNPKALVNLSERLFEAGVLPYYLYLLDKVRGAAHFDMPEENARRLLGAVSARLPGYLVPRLAREIAGEASKVTLSAIT